MMQRGARSAFGVTIARWRHRFFVDADALKRIKPDMPPDEAGFLSAFNSNRKLIYATAAEVYERRRKGSYDLVAADF